MNNNIYHRKQNYIVDRDIEAENILLEIQSIVSSKVKFIYSTTATGKSTLSEKVVASLNSEYTFRIKTLNKNQRNNTPAGEYFYLLFKKMYDTLKNKGNYSLEYYIKKKLDKNIQKELIFNYLEQWANRANLFTVLFTGLLYFVQKWFKIGFYHLENIVSETSLLTKKIQYYYIIYILSNIPCTIIFENFQNIDAQSLDKIIECINQTKKHKNYYIFEYTLNELNAFQDLENLKDLIADCGVDIELMELEDLESTFLPDFVEKHFEVSVLSENFNQDLAAFYKDQNSGNLREIIDFTLNYKDRFFLSENGETLKLIQSLQNLDRIVLFTIIYVNESYTEDQIISFWSEKVFSEDRLKSAIKHLKEYKLIDVSEEKVVLAHASILDTCLNNRTLFNEINTLVYKHLKKYYMQIWENKSLLYSESINIWEIILQLCHYNEPEELWTLFKDIRNNAFITLSPETAWMYINAYVEKTLDHLIQDECKLSAILNICFEFELYEEGYSIFKQIETRINLEKYPVLIVYKSMYLSALDLHKENIKFYHKNKELMINDSDIALNLSLIVLSSYRSLAMKTEWFDLYYNLIKTKEYKCKLEYGYLLRLSDMYFNRKDSVKYIKKSIRFFRKKKQVHQCGKSMITAAHTYAGLGRKNVALIYIKSAEKQLKDKIMGKHMLLVNKAVIYLLKNKKNKLIWDYLDEATLTAVVPFDKLAIIVNKLAWKIANKDCNNIQLLIKQGERYVRLEPDRHIHALFYYNAYYLYKLNNNVVNADKYLELCKKNMEYCTPVKDRLTGNRSSNNKEVLKHEFHICFLSYWTYDILM